MSTGSELAHIAGDMGLSPIEEYRPNGQFRAVQQFICDWADRDTLIVNAAAAPYQRRASIAAYLRYVRIEGFGKCTDAGGGTAQYLKARVTLEFWTDAPFSNTPYVLAEQIEPTVEFIRLWPKAGLRWGSASGDLIMSALPHEVCSLNYILTLYNLTAPPAGASGYVNCCNEEIWTTATMGLAFAPETLLHRGAIIQRTLQIGIQAKYKTVYVWPFRAAGWNTKLREDTLQWSTVFWGNDQVIFHPVINFTDNLIPAP